MSYLTIQRKEGERKKELSIISLQQVVGKHISLSMKGTIKNTMLNKAEEYPDKYKIITKDTVHILSPNKQDITYSGNGKSPWTLLVGYKGFRKKIHFLLIGQRIWGVELDQGLRMKREATRLGYDRLINFLTGQIDSMINTPEKWQNIEIYIRD
ncbi:MAG: hypothetical protein GY870_05535 [archaeon]|nr:hypothetical protein [archaeon]